MGTRGSEWRRWDLHVHTPASIVQHYGANTSETWERFVLELESLPPDLSVIGVNDYLFLDGYKKLLEFKAAGRLRNIELLLPVVELRLSHFGGTRSSWSRVNLHVLFDPILTPEQIEAYFLTALRRSYALSSEAQLANVSWESFPTPETLMELGERIIESVPAERRRDFGSPLLEGFNNLNINLEQVLDALRDQRLKSRHLLAVGKAEWADMKWNDNTIAEKKNIINKAAFVFTAAEDPASALRSKDSLSKEGVKSTLLDCSDAHHFSNAEDKDRLGNCCTWVKAEPTFRGLKYAAIEYDTRVFLGERPPIFSRMVASPNSFIDAVEIVPLDTCPTDKRWLDVRVDLNPELTCIIGNKGSGKSAIADCAALAGNAHNEAEFSFLSARRFRRKPDNLGQYFLARLYWRSGRISERRLADSVDKDSPEEVRYLPQSYLETLCNEVPGGQESLLEKELKRIIFLNLSSSQRAGHASLDELIEEFREQYELRNRSIRETLKGLNSRIIEAERLELPSMRTVVQERINKLEEKLRSHEAKRPASVPAPANDPTVAANNAALLTSMKQAEEELAGLQHRQKDLERTSATVAGELNKLKTALTRLSEFAKLFERLNDNLFADLSGLVNEEDILQIAKLDIDDAIVRDRISTREAQLKSAAAELEDATDSGLRSRMKTKSDELQALRSQLTAPQRAYVKHLEEVAAWENALREIIGNAETANTLEWLRALSIKIQKTPGTLKSLYDQRRAAIKELTQVTDEFRGNLEQLYSASSARVGGASVPIAFEVRTTQSGFVEHLLQYIHLGVRSSFQGVDAANGMLRDLVTNADFSKEDSVADFVEQVLLRLRTVEDSDGARVRIDVESILKGSFKTSEVYDYIAGLEYLRPSFRLLFEERDLSVLSPGQRGMVLLLFYLLVDADESPLIVDQPEENLDNQTVATYLVSAFKAARSRRQIVTVTHNSNLAVVCDADQVIRAHRDSLSGPFKYEVGSLEGAAICRQVIEILEGTEHAFDRRSLKYAQ